MFKVSKMETTIVDFTQSICHTGKFIVVGILLLDLNGACDGYDMENYCDEEFSFILHDEYQIKLGLNDNRIYDLVDSWTQNRKGYCQTKFEARYTTYSKVMFYFENLDLDCDKGHLEFYIGENSNTRVSGLGKDICGYDKPNGVFTVDDTYLQIKYVPKQSQDISDIFSIIITIYGDGFCPRNAYECANSRCIYGQLACNGYDSCDDGSGCGLSAGAIVGIFIGAVVGLPLIISVVMCCSCTRRSGRTPGMVQSTATPAVTYSGQNQQANSQPMYGVHQEPPYNPSQSPYHLASAPSIDASTSGQQVNSHPIYGFNQGVNYPNNQAHYPTVTQNSEINQQPADDKQYTAPPPQYSDLFTNTEQGTNNHTAPLPRYSELFTNIEQGTTNHTAPLPQYSELFTNTEQGTNNHIH